MTLAFWRRRDVPPPIVFSHEVIRPGGDDRYLNRAQLEQASYWLAHIAGAALEEVHEAHQRDAVTADMGMIAVNAMDAELAEVRRDRDEIKVERDELLAALDERRPAPDRNELGLVLQQQWFRWATQERTSVEAWACVADHALDYIRGLWPAPTSSGGGEAATAGVSTAANATGTPTPDDPTREAEADRVRDELGAIIAARDVEYAGGSWQGMHPGLRAYYLDRADAVINAGWRPPLPEVAW